MITYTAGLICHFCFPLASIISLNTAGTSNKLFLVGSIGNLTLSMTKANLLPVSTYCTALTTDCAWTSVSLDSFNLNLKYIDVGDIAGTMLRNTLYQGQYFIKSSTYIGSNSTIANGSYGNVSIPLQIRNSSVKSLFWYYSLSTCKRCPNGFYDAIPNGFYDAIIPNTISSQVNISGKNFPQNH
jgi:hypothetical protein